MKKILKAQSEHMEVVKCLQAQTRTAQEENFMVLEENSVQKVIDMFSTMQNYIPFGKVREVEQFFCNVEQVKNLTTFLTNAGPREESFCEFVLYQLFPPELLYKFKLPASDKEGKKDFPRQFLYWYARLAADQLANLATFSLPRHMKKLENFMKVFYVKFDTKKKRMDTLHLTFPAPRSEEMTSGIGGKFVFDWEKDPDPQAGRRQGRPPGSPD